MLKGKIPYTQLYAVTVTLLPKVRKYGAEQQFDKYGYTVLSEIERLFHNCKVTLVTELTKSYDLHFHGVLSFPMSSVKRVKNFPRWFRDKFRNNPVIGFVQLKVITNDSGWYDYIRKTLNDFQTDVGYCPVLKDDHEITKGYLKPIDNILSDMLIEDKYISQSAILEEPEVHLFEDPLERSQAKNKILVRGTKTASTA